MKKIVTASLVALTLGASLAPAPAQARDGGAIAAGLIGGLVLGGLAAAAAQPQPVYVARPVYYRPRYVRAAGNCWMERRRASDDFGNRYFRRVRVCG